MTVSVLSVIIIILSLSNEQCLGRVKHLLPETETDKSGAVKKQNILASGTKHAGDRGGQDYQNTMSSEVGPPKKGRTMQHTTYACRSCIIGPKANPFICIQCEPEQATTEFNGKISCNTCTIGALIGDNKISTANCKSCSNDNPDFGEFTQTIYSICYPFILVQVTLSYLLFSSASQLIVSLMIWQ